LPQIKELEMIFKSVAICEISGKKKKKKSAKIRVIRVPTFIQ